MTDKDLGFHRDKPIIPDTNNLVVGRIDLSSNLPFGNSGLGRDSLVSVSDAITPNHPVAEPWITTISQRKINLLDPKVSDIDIRDIAHALSRICRWNGHLRGGPFSVAQHSVLVSRRVKSQRAKFWALMHDGSEAYLGDVITPVKNLLPKFHTIEDNFAEVIRECFDIPYDQEISDEIREADRDLMFLERDSLVLGRPLSTPVANPYPSEDMHPNITMYDLDANFYTWGYNLAQENFLFAFNSLCSGEHTV